MVRLGLEANGADVDVHCVNPSDMQARLKEAIAGCPDAIIVGGGDGTIRSAASELIGTEIPLGVLPLGTLNRLARDLKMPLDFDEAVRCLAHAEVDEIDVAEVNGRIFLCNSLIGLPIAVAERRRRLRGEGLSKRFHGYLELLGEVWRSRRRFDIDLHDPDAMEGAPRRFRAITIAISNNSYAESPSLTLYKESMRDGELAIYIACHRSGRDMLVSLLRAFLGTWRADPDVVEIRSPKVTLRSRRRNIRMSNDGEIETLECPLEYRIRAERLSVLRPHAEARI